MRAWASHALTILADAQLRAGDAVRAAQVAREALEIADATNDRACVGWAVRAQGQAALALGNFAEARDCFDRAVLLFEELGARIDLAKALVERSVLSAEQCMLAAARNDLRCATEHFNACGVVAPLARVARLEAAASGDAARTTC
jgi:tetratricopeptide (TPR) repeat protein